MTSELGIPQNVWDKWADQCNCCPTCQSSICKGVRQGAACEALCSCEVSPAVLAKRKRERDKTKKREDEERRKKRRQWKAWTHPVDKQMAKSFVDFLNARRDAGAPGLDITDLMDAFIDYRQNLL